MKPTIVILSLLSLTACVSTAPKWEMYRFEAKHRAKVEIKGQDMILSKEHWRKN